MPEFKNPNQAGGPGGSQDSRSFLVMIIVMFAVILGLRYWQGQHATTPEAQPAAVSQPASAPSVNAAVTAPAGTINVQTVQATAEATTVVENELYKITFSNHGGQVTSWILKKFTNTAGQPLDLVHQPSAAQFGFPLSLYTYEPALTKKLAEALYVPSVTGNLIAPATLSYTYAAGDLSVTKTFSFGADYVLHADTVVLRDGFPIRALLAWPSAFGDMETATSFAQSQLDTSINGKDDHEAPKKVIGGATLTGPFDFAGTTDQYFAAIFMPDQPVDSTVATLDHQMDAKDIPASATLTAADFHPVVGGPVKGFVRLPLLGSAVGALSGHNELRLFVGPKALPVLKSIKTVDGKDLGPVLDFGFWGPVAKGLYIGLHFVQEHVVSNWGWAIIVFTVFINLVLLPLRVQGMKSMLKMQRIQPQIDAIKAKYKNPKPTDPRMAEMNAEVMDLQKANGVSMFGGCIPTLIQLPLLIAFFTMMTRVVELRHSHWFWLHDLSSADPYHILPILMFATSFIAQYYTPSPGVDPQQQKMMAFMMPVFSAYMTWNYASALGLYWNVGNFIMIAQQQVMNRTSLGREMKELQLKRAQRKVGSPAKPMPKTIPGRR